MDFEAIIRAVIDTASAEAQLNSLLKERQIKIEPVIDSKMYDGMNKQFKIVTSAASAAGSKINKSFSNSIKSGDFHLSDGFIKEQKKILNDNSLMQKKIISAYKTTQSEANKIVNKGRSEQNKQLRKQQIKEANTYRKANKYSSDYSTGKYDALHTQNKNKLQQYSNKAVSYPSAVSAIEKETSAYKELTKAQQEFTSNRSYENAVRLSQAHDNITKSANQAKNAFSMLGSEQAKLISPNRTANFTSSVQGYVQSNPRAYKKLQTEFDSILKSSKSTQMSSKEFSRLESQFSNLKLSSQTAGLEGNSIFGELGRGFKQIGQFALTYGTIQKGVDQFVKSIGNLKDIDSILTEISKTSDMNKSQLKGLGKDSFSHASKYGKLSTDWLLGVQEMNRSGFYGQKGQNMADLSVLAQSAGDLSADVANSYLLATNAAYDYKGSAEKLNAVLDGQNEITNRNSVSMEDMAAATSKAASMGSQMGVTEDQLSALIGTTEARTKSGGDQVGTSLKSLFINLQNINSSKIVETLNKAGASMTEIKNGSQQLRTPIQILGDLQKTFNKLGKSDPLRAEILTNIGGKYHANKLSAILSGWSDYEKMLKDYSEGAGSAQTEADKSANNWEGSLNKLSNTWTSIINNFANSDGIIAATNALNSLLGVVNSLSSSLGTFGSFGSILGAVLGVKDLGVLQYNAKTNGIGLNSKINSGKGNNPKVLDNFSRNQQSDFNEFTKNLNAGDSVTNAKAGLTNLTDEMLAYGAAAEAGSASAEGFNAHLAATSATAQGVSVATKAASIGMRALSMVGNMAIMAVAAIAIQQVIKGIDELAHRSENLIKAGDDVKKKYSKKISDAKNQLKDLKSSQSEFNTLSQGIDDHGKNKGLTSDQYEKVSAQRNELLKEYPSLVQGYDAEGNAIANNNELMQKAIDLQKEKIALAKEESVNPENFEKQGAGAYEKYKKNKEKSALAIGKFNLSDTFRDKKDQAEVNKVVQDLYGFDFFGTDGYVTTNQGNKKTAMDNMDKIVNGLESRKKLTAEQIGKLTTLSTDYKGYQKKADDALKDFGKDTLSIIPQTVSGYDKLSKSGKNFLSKWTDNQDVAAFMGNKNNGKNDEDKLANLRSETKEFAEKIVGNTDIQDAYKKYNKTFSDTTKQSALSWQESVKEQYNNVVSAMKDGGVDMNDAAKEQLKKTLNLNLDKNGSVLLEDGRNVLDMVNELNKKFELTTEAQNYFSNLNLDGLNNAFQTAIVNSDTFTGSLDQLKQRIELLKNTSATANFTLEGYSQALDTENAGQDYLRIMEGLKETKEAWNKSLVGTDEFKTFAGMISPSGKTDADNFKENYDNIKKYFTEGTSGPEKFLDALTNKTDSAGNAFLKFNEKTQKWSGNIKDTTEAAKKLGMGVEPFEAMLNRLKDYDIKVDFTSTVDKYKEANSQLSKWTENWVKNGGKQGDAEGKEIESFKQKVLEAKQAGETIPDNWLKTLKFKVDLSDLNNQLNQAEKDLEAAQSGSGVGKEKKIESAAETADKVSYELIGKTSVKNGQLQNISGDIKSAKIPVEYEVKGKNITDYVNEVKTAQKSLSEATTVDQKESSINTYLSSLNNLKGFLNTYTSDKLGKDFKFKADTSDVDKKTKEAKDKAKDGGTMKVKGDTSDVDKKTTQAKQNAKTGGTMKINGDTSNVDKKIADTKSKGDKTKIGPVKMEVKPEVAKAKEAVENLKTGGFSGAFNTLTTPSPSPAKPQSNTAQDSGNAKTGKTATVTTTVKAKDEASSVIDKIKKSANSLKNKTISVKAKGNASSVIKKISSALKKLKSKSIKISIKGTASSVIKKISSALKKLKSKTVTVKAKDKASPTIKKTSSGLKKLKSKTVTVKAEDNASGILGNIKSLLSGIKSKTVTVTTSFKQQGSPVSGGGVVNGTANAQGTAGSKVKRATWKPSYSTGTIDEIDDLDIIEQFGDFAYARGTIPNRANADGNWGAKESSTALTGELGQELIVRGNRWYTVGDHGAEFRDIKKGDIIFNHRQTRQLLKNGKITGRAKAYAHGTAFNRGASISGGFKGGKYDNSTKKHSDAVKKDTKETKKHGDQTKKNKKKLTALEKYLESVGKRFDFVEIKLSNLSKATERIANSITEFVSATYKATQLMKQYNSVGKEISGQKKGQSRYTKAYKDFAKTAKKKAPGKTKKAKKSNAKKLDKYFKLVRDPGFNIKNIKNDSMRSAVEQYKEYYDKARACKDAVQELKNTQRELFNQWLNMPIEAAQAKIDKLSKSYDALSAKASVASSGGSGIANLASLQGTQISAAEKDVASKTTAKSKAKSEKDAASKKYSKAKKADKKAAKSLSKNKKKTTKALKKDKKLSKKKQKQISKGQTISTKGLKGKTLKQAKAYNKSAKKRNSTKKNLSKQQKAAKTANSRLSAANTSLSQSQGYLNTLKKQEADAQKYANGPAYEYQNYLLDQQVSNKKAQNDANQKALKDAHGNYTKYNNQKSAAKTKVTNKANSIKKNKKLYKKLNASQKKALSEGKAVSTKGIKDKKLLKQIQDYNKLVSSYSSAAQKAADASNALSTATVNAQTSQAELAQEMTEAAKAMSANIKAFYDAKVAYEEGLGSQAESANKLKQTKGLDLSEADYNKQFEANARKRAVLVEEQQKLQEQLNKSVASGSIKQGSQEWYELQNEITSVENSITDLDTSTEELKDTMRDDVFYRGFERALKAAEALRSSLEAISSVIDEDAMFDDNGYITDYGITAMAINVQTIQSYRDSMKTLLKEREQIEKDYKSGQYSDTQYTEKVQENEKNIADAVKNIKSSEDSVINIIKNQAKAELDAKNKMIEAYQKALQSKKDYYDYDKTLKNSNKEIQILKSKIAALNGVTDAESRAEKARLEAELQEKVDAKNDTIKDHIYQLQVDGLDELKTELNDDYEKYVKKLSQSVEEIDKALSDMANIISGSASNVGDTLESILSHFGINAKDIGLENINIAHAATGGLVKATKRAGDDGLSTLKIDEEVVTADVVQTSRTLIPKLDKIVTNPTIDKLTNMNYSIPAPAFSDGLGNNEFNFNYSGDAVSIGSIEGKISEEDLNRLLDQACQYTRTKMVQDIAKTLGKKPRVR